jgi:regulator of sigma E protease
MSVVNTIGAVIAPKSGIKLQHLGGPLFIFRTYYLLFQSEQGWRMALWFSVVLNVNLALLNMLPIPVLDGGHILLALIEAVRRRPANIRVLEVIQTACVVVILSYMAYVTFFDVGDLAAGRATRRELEFPSPSPAGK